MRIVGGLKSAEAFVWLGNRFVCVDENVKDTHDSVKIRYLLWNGAAILNLNTNFMKNKKLNCFKIVIFAIL